MKALRIIGRVLVVLIKVALGLFTVLVPTLGIWAGSSLAAYAGGPLWLAITAGLLAFPVLPLAWETRTAIRRRDAEKAGEAKPTVMTFGDRMVMRSLAINVVFLTALLAFGPRTLFTALTTRGDWMLDDVDAATADAPRRWLFRTADWLEGVYASTQANEYRQVERDTEVPEDDTAGEVERRAPTPTPTPEPEPDTNEPTPDGTSPPPDPPPPAPDPPENPAPEPAAGLGGATPSWPLPQEMHPLVAAIPRDAESSWRAVARYMRSNEPNDTRLVKALHDYLADRIAYDAPNYAAGRYPPQDPDTVFATRIGVCAGYALLFEAMAEEAGLEAAYVVGSTRELGHAAHGVSHAWNAVRVDGRWYLLDVTWDAGSVDGAQFERRYRTDYLFVPPEIMRTNHLPEDARWQLSDTPISRGEFQRQPMMQPAFYRHGLGLVSPDRSALTVSDVFDVLVENPLRRSVIATYESAGAGRDGRHRCEASATEGDRWRLRCELPRAGHYRVWLFAADRRNQTHWSVGGFEVVRE